MPVILVHLKYDNDHQGERIMSFINPDHQVAVDAERMRLQELCQETGLDIELVAANQVQLRRRSLAATRQTLAEAVAAAAWWKTEATRVVSL